MENTGIQSAPVNTETILAEVFKKAGGQKALAIELGLTKQAVNKWPRVPQKYVVRVAELTGIPASKLRPDLFGLFEADVARSRKRAVAAAVSRL